MAKSGPAIILGTGFGLALFASLALIVGSMAGPARADTAGQLDTQSRATDRPGSGIALARRQINADDLLEAMATLERVLMNNPSNLEARALHAGLLCRIDDRRGAIMEFDSLRGLNVPQSVSAEARMPCRGGR
ncbi:MAG: hypothetical protein P8J20_07835 [Novosphingobium sp.]|nr:hypothetical protein [Novosphingobium sp.]